MRRRPALKSLDFGGFLSTGAQSNPLGDEGLAALVAPPPPPPAGAPPTTGVLAKLKWLYLGETQVNDAGCVALVAALNRGALPALGMLDILLIPASAAAKDAVREALATSRAAHASPPVDEMLVSGH